ncbi:MAG TPA: hypothetical protein VG722_07040 [Tepidisphaeraceae bacterium]|nr:hypothetical protein [Tepidisphaeraceae bacterium]
MVIAYHVIFTAYGFWLPNDPRGSWSDFVRSWELYRFGPSTPTHSRRSVACASHDSNERLSAKTALKYSSVSFTGRQCLSIANGFKDAIRRSQFTIHACAILPEHVHIVLARHRYAIEKVRDQLKGQASKSLRADGLHPFACESIAGKPHSPWSDGGWDVYLNSTADIRRAIQYVNDNPVREGKPRQTWSVVTPLV